jgi:hypothetical protein
VEHLLTIWWDGRPGIGSTATGLSNCFRESCAFRSVSWQPRNSPKAGAAPRSLAERAGDDRCAGPPGRSRFDGRDAKQGETDVAGDRQRSERRDGGGGVDAVQHECRLNPVKPADDGGKGGGDAVVEQDGEQAEHAKHAAGQRQARGAGGKREGQPDDAGDEQGDSDRVERHGGDHRAALAGERGDPGWPRHRTGLAGRVCRRSR